MITMRVYGGSEDSCDDGGDAEGQKIKKNCSSLRQTRGLGILQVRGKAALKHFSRGSRGDPGWQHLNLKKKRLAASEPSPMLTHMGRV